MDLEIVHDRDMVGIFDNNWWSRPIFNRINDLVFAEYGKWIFTVGGLKPQNCNPTNTRQVLLIQLSILLDFCRSIWKYRFEIDPYFALVKHFGSYKIVHIRWFRGLCSSNAGSNMDRPYWGFLWKILIWKLN